MHYNSSRTGVRLIGPKPHWARSDGGEAGLHPSNIHDNAYAIGTIDFTGDMPVILGPDGPSLGGFVCPATIVQADCGKSASSIRAIRALSESSPSRQPIAASRSRTRTDRNTDDRDQPIDTKYLRAGGTVPPILASAARRTANRSPSPIARPATSICWWNTVRWCWISTLRFRVHALMEWLQAQHLPGIIDLTPGIRSLQIHYDSRVLSQRALLDTLLAGRSAICPASMRWTVPSRIVHLPLSWDDPATRLAIEKYMQSVRNDAPWCPSNIEFIRRINGLDSIDEVMQIVFDASYLVMGLGDVYLGAPVATPLDPRHRLVTTKYNPARTWTPENAVGIGGAYLCVYGMEGPGGYQFVGRTVQMWNRYRQTGDFTDGKPWLLRFFDQIRFYPVSGEELLSMRDDFLHGRFQLEVEQTELKLSDYRRFLDDNRADILAFKTKQQAAFEAERERWELSGQAHYTADPAGDAASADASLDLPAGCTALASPVTGSVWQIAVKPGDRVQEGDELLVVEAMKMEIPIQADEAGTWWKSCARRAVPCRRDRPC